MAKPYAMEIQKLAETFAWATTIDINPLRRVVRTGCFSPLIAIGSGGSLTAAHALTSLHQRLTGRIATVVTPLEVAADQLENSVATWLLSAGGGNVDILSAAKLLIAREPSQIAVLCGKKDSPLTELCQKHPFVDLMIYPPPAGKDGFLATNSLLGFVSLLARAYTLEFAEAEWTDAVKLISLLVHEDSFTVATWEKLIAPLWERSTTLILHGPSTRIGAIDLESKFTEAALGNVQLADYRNFAHGRHHWLAKRGETSAVLAFVSDQDRQLADRTLALIPTNIPQARVEFSGTRTAVGLGSLVAALRITGWAGIVRGIDPGRPGVPDFGRKLYHLPLPRHSDMVRGKPLSDHDAIAISRKAGLPVARLVALGEMKRWKASLDDFRNRLLSTSFTGIVMDYDGTLVDTRYRFDLVQEDLTRQLIRLIESGVYLAIATGRGVSVRRDLRASVPKPLWSRVLVGYYNGAEIATLDNDEVPDGSDGTCELLAPIATALRTQPELADVAQQTNRRFQITLEAKRMMPENRLWDLAHQVLLSTASANASITRSSHSIDILAPGVSKLNVLAHLCASHDDARILTIGDRGRWPGNDYELLKDEFALTVDEASVDPMTCWNLAPGGQRGVAATLNYLSALEMRLDGLWFHRKALQ